MPLNMEVIPNFVTKGHKSDQIKLAVAWSIEYDWASVLLSQTREDTTPCSQYAGLLQLLENIHKPPHWSGDSLNGLNQQGQVVRHERSSKSRNNWKSELNDMLRKDLLAELQLNRSTKSVAL